jgi:hypothetical protein
MFPNTLYPNHYVWYVLLSTIDVLLTSLILSDEFKGREVNLIADRFIRQFGWWGAVALKYSTVIIVVAVCEIVGRRRTERAGRMLAVCSIVISLVPIGVALLQLGHYGLSGPHVQLQHHVDSADTRHRPIKPAKESEIDSSKQPDELAEPSRLDSPPAAPTQADQ